MNKKVWSIILLCVICIAFVCEVGLFISYGISFNGIENNDAPPDAGLAVGAAYVMLFFGTIIAGGIIASVGFFCSLINIKIAPTTVMKNISIASVCVWSVIFLLLMGALVHILL